MESLEVVAQRQRDTENKLKIKRIEEIVTLMKFKEFFIAEINEILSLKRGISDIVKNGILIVYLPTILGSFGSSADILTYLEKINILIDKETFEKGGYCYKLRIVRRDEFEKYPFLIISTKKMYQTWRYYWILHRYSLWKNSVNIH